MGSEAWKVIDPKVGITTNGSRTFIPYPYGYTRAYANGAPPPFR